jgi:GxxExxY protein
MKVPLYFKNTTDLISTLAKKVQNNLGNCFTKAIYADALEREFIANGVQHERSVPLAVFYPGSSEPLGHKYRVDFIVEGKVLVLVKAAEETGNAEQFDVVTMLQASGKTFALLIQVMKENVVVNKFVRYTKFANSVNRGEDWGVEEDSESAGLQRVAG